MMDERDHLKKLKDWQVRTALELMVIKYEQTYGKGFRNLERFKLPITGPAWLYQCMPSLTVRDSKGVKHRKFVHVVRELEILNYAERRDDGVSIVITPEGYSIGRMKTFRRILEFFNEHPGAGVLASILIAFLSLVVAIASLLHE